MTTSEHSPPNDWRQTELPLTSSAAGSPAKTSPSQEREQGSPASGRDYGASTPVLLASYDPATSSWRTSQLCLDGGLATYSETWPRSGLMRSGTAFQLPPLVPLIAGIDFGSWPTPTVSSGAQVAWDPTQGQTGGTTLEGAVRWAEGLWPTPRSTDGSHGGRVTPRKSREGGNLVEAVSARYWPTPTRSDWQKRRKTERWAGNDLVSQVALSEGLGGLGSLNPTWVEWLMGFPPNWTEL